METTKLWHLRTLFGHKIILAILFILMAVPAFAQQSREYHLPTWDERFITYGFTLGGHVSSLRPKFSQEFIREDGPYRDVLNIIPGNNFGFSIGFLSNFKAAQFLDIRLMPKIAFYDYSLTVQSRETNQEISERDVVVDYTTLDIPISLKFKSMRRNNHRMFFTTGVTPIVDITGKKRREENSESGLRLSGNNLTADIGIGADFYFPFFRFSPEIRYSYGLRDVLENKTNEYGQAFDRIGTHIIGFYLVFN